MNLETKLVENNSEKWFVLYDNGYQGHFSKQDIEYLFNSKQIGIKNLIWNESLITWCEIQTRPEFSHLDFSIARANYVQNIDPQILTAIQGEQAPRSYIAYQLEDLDLKETTVEVKNNLEIPQKRSLKHLYYYASGVALILTSALVMSQWPSYKDVRGLSDQENYLLKAATQAEYRAGGVKVEMVTKSSKLDNELMVYVSTNLPKVRSLQISIESIPESLIGRQNIKESTEALIENKLAQAKFDFYKTEKIIPGFYKISVQNQDKTIAQKSILLGALNEAEYRSALATYRTQLNEQAKNEIAELKQVLFLVENQKNQLNKNLKNGALKNWREVQSQITTMAQYWTAKETPQQYYSLLFKTMQTLILDVSQLEKENTSSLNEKTQASLDSLKSQLTYLENSIAN